MRRLCYDLSVWLSATGVLVTTGSKGSKPLTAVREGVLVVGVVQHIWAMGP